MAVDSCGLFAILKRKRGKTQTWWRRYKLTHMGVHLSQVHYLRSPAERDRCVIAILSRNIVVVVVGGGGVVVATVVVGGGGVVVVIVVGGDGCVAVVVALLLPPPLLLLL